MVVGLFSVLHMLLVEKFAFVSAVEFGARMWLLLFVEHGHFVIPSLDLDHLWALFMRLIVVTECAWRLRAKWCLALSPTST